MKHFQHFISVALLFAANLLSAQVITQTLSYSGTSQTLAIPGCVSQVSMTCYGAKGANGASTASSAVGGSAGQGGMATGVYSMIASGTTLNIFVGGAASGSVAGYNGGGSGGRGNSGAGGGASDIRVGGTALANRVIVAGGGGGGGSAGCASSTITGGAGGAGGGGNGTNGVNSVAGQGGKGAIGTTGGAAGIGCSFASGTVGANGISGQAGAGGNGPNVCGAYVSGGGGGGGYFGGGGGGGGSAGTTSCTLNDQGAGGGGAGGTTYFSSAFTNTSVTNGVNNGNGYVVISYSVGPAPSISVNSGSICSNNSFVITPSGANSYTVTGGSFTVGPLVTTSYSVSGDFSGCPATNTAVATVSVYTTPTISVNSGSMCTGSVFTITPTGATSYTFQGGSANVSPLVNSTYTVAGTSINGCNSNIVTSTLNVTLTPVVTASTTQTLTCSQSTVSLNGVGATNYTWTGPSILSGANTASAVVSAPGTYSLQGEANGCTSSLTAVSVTQNTVAPTLSLATSPATICNGSSATLTVMGADSYSWNTGPTSVSISVNPSATTVYSVTGTSTLNGCSSTGSVELNVNPIPTVTIVSPINLTCITSSIGLSASVTASGTTAYVWTGPSVLSGSASATAFVDAPGIYSLDVSVENCSASTATVSVLQNTIAPTLSLSATSVSVCFGSSVTLISYGADNYSWTSGSTSATINLSPLMTTTYAVTGISSINGCTSIKQVTVFVNAVPTLSILPTTTTGIVCTGETVTLTASGAITYSWVGYSTTNILLVTPTVSSSYTVIGTNSEGCSNAEDVILQVSECTGIQEKFTQTPAKVFPNPASDQITVELTDLKEPVQIQIVNMLGEVVMNELLNANSESLNIASLKAGVYFIKLGTDVGQIKIIKQ